MKDHGPIARLRRCAWLALCLLLLPPVSICGPGRPSYAAGEPALTGVRLASEGGRLRLQLDLTQRAEFRAFLLADPYRVVIDLAHVAWRPAEPPPSYAEGPVAGFRYGQFQPGTSRLVVDARVPLLIQQTQLLEPPTGAASGSWRLVIDLVPASREAVLQAMHVPPPPVPAGPGAALPGQTQPGAGAAPRPPAKRVVAIDPGHGGVDPGTIGASGTLEKNVTLEVAREVKRTLEASGRYRVVLTREDDTFIRLRERIQVARAAGAELFISVHADALADAQFHGATVYTLSDKASDAEAQRLADAENRADAIGGINLTDEPTEVADILIDLAQRETRTFSNRFARLLMGEMRSAVRMHKNPLKSAGFRVLKAPDVPSVLVELGYVSNKSDLEHLVSESWRSKTVSAMGQAIDAFLAKRLATAGASH